MKSINDLIDDISGKTVSMSYDDTQIKLDLVIGILREFVIAGKQVQYIDFDLQFSSLLKNLTVKEQEEFHDVLVFPQITDAIDSVFAISESCLHGGIVMLDTFNTLQCLMLPGNLEDSVAANHRTAIVVSLLEDIARFYSKTLLMLNLTKSRPRTINDVILWERDLVGGRMSRFKSDLILYARDSITKGRRVISIETVSPKSEDSETYELESDISWP